MRSTDVYDDFHAIDYVFGRVFERHLVVLGLVAVGQPHILQKLGISEHDHLVCNQHRPSMNFPFAFTKLVEVTVHSLENIACSYNFKYIR